MAEAANTMHSANRLYERAPVGLCYLDEGLRYLQVNRWLAELNGVPVDQHIGRSIDVVIPKVAHRVRGVLQGVLNTATPVIGGRVTAETRARPSHLRTFEHDYYPDLDSTGTVIGVSCIVWDVTARPDMSVRNMPGFGPGTPVSRLVSTLHYIVSQSGHAVSGPTRVRLPEDPASLPSSRENAVLLSFISHGSIEGVAAHLHLSPHTVRKHLKALYQKYRVNSAVELVCSALGTLGQDLV